MPDSEIVLQIEDAVQETRREDWGKYRVEFEHVGSVSSHPLLADPVRFKSFCLNWGIARTIRAGTHDELRCALRDSTEFALALEDTTGNALDRLESALRVHFGTRGGKRGVISALSKIATFVRPDRFTAWDEYARTGLNIALGHPQSRSFSNYAHYIGDFNAVWSGPIGEKIRSITERVAESPVEKDLRFRRRVLDKYLMKVGGFVWNPSEFEA